MGITPKDFDYRMNRGMHAGLLNHLQVLLSSPKDCDRTRRHTEQWLIAFARNWFPADPLIVTEVALDWLTEHGGHCDCTVILNTFPERGFGLFGPADDLAAFNRWLDAEAAS